MFGLRRRMISSSARRWFSNDPPAEALSAGWAVDLPEVVGRNRSARRRRRDVGKRPELWDFYISDRCIHNGLWKEIMPISAKVIRENTSYPIQQLPHDPFLEARRPASGLLSHIVSIDNFAFLRRSRAASEVPPLSSPPPSAPGRLEVAIVVAMPSRSQPRSQSEPESLDYTLGLAEIPWREEFELRELELPDTQGV